MEVVSPLQMVSAAGVAIIFGDGFTVTTKSKGVPVQFEGNGPIGVMV